MISRPSALDNLDQAKEIFQRAFEYCPDGLLVSDRDGRISTCNPQIESMFGYSNVELIGQPIEILLPERFRDSHPAHRRDYNAQPRMREMGAGLELYGRRKGGSEFPVDIMLNSLNTAQGVFILSVIRDVTQQKKTQEVLHLTEERFRLLVENARDYAIFLMGTEGKVVTWNPGAECLKGYRADEIIGQSFSRFYTPEDVSRGIPQEALRAASERERFESEGWRVRKDGSRFWANAVITSIRDLKGHLIGFAKVTRDFTERKRAEQELREQAALLELAHDSIIVRDMENRIVFWNRGAEEKYGWTRQEALGKVIHSFLQTEFPQPFEEVEEKLQRHHYWEGELVHTTKGGEKITVASRQVLQRDTEGHALAILEINNDITEKKQAEHALRRSEEHLHALFEFSPDAMIVCSRDGFIRSVNAQVERFFGYARSELIGQPIETLVPERFRHAHLGHRRDFMKQPRTRPMGAGLELYGRRKDGIEFPVDITLSPLDHEDGSLIIAGVRDLTERKQAEEAIRRADQEKRYLEEELHSSFEEIIGESTGLKTVLKQIETVAPTSATVLVLGETGTGKELIARAVHRLSGRSERAFVKLNCAAIPSGLLESELFGHEKGAFTGAIAQKIGRLELAHQGTLFLDEVGDIPLELQPKLLRALQEKEFERLGSTRTIAVDVRLIAATNRNLETMVADKQFRSDLYYRLKVFPITIPALRERREDIPLLVRYFVHMHARRMDKRIETIPPETMETLIRWNWPGNVRELENFMERAVILTSGPVLRTPLGELETVGRPTSVTGATLESTEREHILRVLRETKGMIGGPDGAAVRLGLKRTTLNSKMKKLGIQRSDYR